VFFGWLFEIDSNNPFQSRDSSVQKNANRYKDGGDYLEFMRPWVFAQLIQVSLTFFATPFFRFSKRAACKYMHFLSVKIIIKFIISLHHHYWLE